MNGDQIMTIGAIVGLTLVLTVMKLASLRRARVRAERKPNGPSHAPKMTRTKRHKP